MAHTVSAAWRRRLVAAPDAFKGTASAPDVARAMQAASRAAGWDADTVPLSDGGEGFAAVLARLAPTIRTARVSGPLGAPVAARWRFDEATATAVVESAEACGLALAGGPAGNDPVAASTYGVGELIATALAAGARRIVVGVGGSATTDGGAGAVDALLDAGGFGAADVAVACDVSTAFLDAARVFGPQKGATPDQVELLTGRLADVARRYRSERGLDVTLLEFAGAAGGLAGGLASLGARLVAGFDLVAEVVGLDGVMAGADLVLTGEGRLDATSWRGKVVGGVAERGRAAGVPVVVLAGSIAPDADAPSDGLEAVDLSARFGQARALHDPCGCVAAATGELLRARMAR